MIGQSAMKSRTARRARALLRLAGPGSLRFRRRVALLGGAVTVGVVALLFAKAADVASEAFVRMVARAPLAPLLITPLGLMLIVWITRRHAPLAAGSGIPQVIAAIEAREGLARRLVELRMAVMKMALTIAALLAGGSVGREGPTVQISAAIMEWTHRVMKVRYSPSVMIAGGAAGVAAAFNTPLAGIAFAIEELASAYEQRTTLLVITAVIISGMVSLSLAGNYTYFGVMSAQLPLGSAVLVAVMAGVAGGLSGGLFSRLLLGFTHSDNPLVREMRAKPLLAAILCGLVIATIGVATGNSWGTSYAPARDMLQGEGGPLWFGPAKFASTLATALSGVPGGIFAPSLATGAGIGNLLAWFFPQNQAGAVVLLGMVGYFTGVVRAPLTAVIIIAETTGSRGFMLPLLCASLTADWASQRLCREKLYHGLSRRFLREEQAPRKAD